MTKVRIKKKIYKNLLQKSLRGKKKIKKEYGRNLFRSLSEESENK